MKQNENEINDYIIPPSLFQVPKKVVLSDLPYCAKNEEFPQ